MIATESIKFTLRPGVFMISVLHGQTTNDVRICLVITSTRGQKHCMFGVIEFIQPTC